MHKFGRIFAGASLQIGNFSSGGFTIIGGRATAAASKLGSKIEGIMMQSRRREEGRDYLRAKARVCPGEKGIRLGRSQPIDQAT
jgi:hypothetical protein